MSEIDVLLVENRSPLERRSVEALARGAMAVFGSQRTVTTEFVLYAPTVTSSFPFGFEVVVFVMDAVGSTVLPLILFAMSGRSGLVLVRLVCTLASLTFGAISRRIRHLSTLWCYFQGGSERSQRL